MGGTAGARGTEVLKRQEQEAMQERGGIEHRIKMRDGGGKFARVLLVAARCDASASGAVLLGGPRDYRSVGVRTSGGRDPFCPSRRLDGAVALTACLPRPGGRSPAKDSRKVLTHVWSTNTLLKLNDRSNTENDKINEITTKSIRYFVCTFLITRPGEERCRE